MKWNDFAGIFFVAGIFLCPNNGFSTEAETKSVDTQVATLDGKTTSSAVETTSPVQNTLGNGDFVEESEKPAPIALVSASPKSEHFETAKASVAVKKKERFVASSNSAVSPIRTAVNSSKEAKVALPNANSSEMQKNWNALFSEGISPGSVSYIVRSGDSLYVLAKKFHTTVDFIKRLNNRDNDALYPNMKLKIFTDPFSIVVSKTANTLVLYVNNKPVKQYSIATGKKNCTPSGTFRITNKLVNPTWFKTGAILPPGSPENALGSRWMGFDKPEYGIHGTIDPKSIGTQSSQGCIRMLNEDVEELYSMVPPGTQVTIQD